MARIALVLCLMLTIASNVIYEAQGHFVLNTYVKQMPQKCNEFTPFANKGILELCGDLEAKCPPTPEFKSFFTSYRSYMSFVETTSSTSKNVDVELTTKAEGLFKAMSTLCGTNGAKGGKSADGGNFKVNLISMGKTLLEQKKSTKVMTQAEKKRMVTSMEKWTESLASFCKTASEKKGKTIEISSFGLKVDMSSFERSERSSSSSKSRSSSSSHSHNSSSSESASNSSKHAKGASLKAAGNATTSAQTGSGNV